MKKSILLLLTGLFLSQLSFSQTFLWGGRMNEVFYQTDLVTKTAANQFNDPWEVTYGPDDSLWITESKGYCVYKISPNGPQNSKRKILDIHWKSTWLGSTPASDSVFNVQFDFTSKNPQGGLAGLAIHPEYMTDPNKRFVYISYIRTYVKTLAGNAGVFYLNSIVRFKFNPATGTLDNPVTICDTLPGSSDHNSQRMIIAPVNGVNYLFYAAGDMGAGQFGNASRTNNAQNKDVYEGKILRFNLDNTGLGTGVSKWIPEDNPFNGAIKSAVWVTGIRNNQGFAYDSVRNILYGSSHGPHSDDEVNIIDIARNYGHPLVEGYSWDDNYNSSSAGFPGSSLPVIVDESNNASGLTNYRDPIFSGYPSTQATINNIYLTSPPNGGWPSEGWSGLGLYNYSVIPGWKNSLVMSGLKWGRLIRVKLNSGGTAVIPTNGTDTVCYFDSDNRFRDIAFAPNGKDIFVIMDKSAATSGPSANNPSVVACPGCLQKYTFVGYNNISGTSSLPNSIDIAPGKTDACENMNTVNISPANNNAAVWVPITDTLGNIVAEIKANGQNLGNVTTSVYVKSGAPREFGFNKVLYSNRSITITPSIAPVSTVDVRLYLNNAEFTSLKNGFNSLSQPSGIGGITNVGVYKNADPSCGSAMGIIPSAVNIIGSPYTRDVTTGYVIHVTVTGFSTFYFAKLASALPLHLISFKGALTDDIVKLQWLVENETKTKSYIIERSANGMNFDSVGTSAAQNAATKFTYYFSDAEARKLSSSVIYYRLKMIDANNQFSYSDVVKLNINLTAGTINVRPNPVVSEATVDIFSTTAEKASWILTDINGKTVMQHGLNLRKGDNALNINLSSLPAGMYYLKVSGNNINQAIKLQKL